MSMAGFYMIFDNLGVAYFSGVTLDTYKLLCGYWLSTGPTEGLSSWWSRNMSFHDSQQLKIQE